MNCHSTRAVLDLHAEGRLTKGRAKAVASHLESCAACRAAAAPAPSSAAKPSADFKARLSAALKSGRASSAPSAAPALALWPRDLSGVAVAAAALALAAAVIGWSGAPSQQYDRGDELAGRTP